MTRAAGALAALLVLAGAMGACSTGRNALTIYSGRDEALVGPLLERFAEQADIDVDVRYGDSADLALLIAEEGDATPADVFFSQSPGAVQFLGDQGALGLVPQPVLERVDERFRSAHERWVGVTGRQRVLVYNRELVDEADLPDSVLDLTEARFAGEVGVAPPNASFQDFVTAMRQMLGDDAARRWLEGMAANDSPTFPDNNSIVDAVARGEIPMGLVNHYYNYRYLAENPDAPSRNHVFPEGDIGALLIESSVAILDTTDKRDAARRFVDFLLSRPAQEYFAANTFEYPLVAGVAASEDLPPLGSLDVPRVDIQDLGDLRTTVEMIERSGLR